jgi:hypothetical protein
MTRRVTDATSQGQLQKAFGGGQIAIRDSRKSVVLPAESIALYKQVQRPATRI